MQFTLNPGYKQESSEIIQGYRILSVSIMRFSYYIPEEIVSKVYLGAIYPVRWISKSHRQKTKEIHFSSKRFLTHFSQMSYVETIRNNLDAVALLF